MTELTAKSEFMPTEKILELRNKLTTPDFIIALIFIFIERIVRMTFVFYLVLRTGSSVLNFLNFVT